ncbi:hypothetical protein H6501_05255 [Candidatus Woesearchaeota archaeon]|nr:hypothetical protein [Nanoarchaeota archaeon]MCB9370981.1 hypothetical protein [Candidatus Woesearchaeota archaeon]USN44082.1 MAG: hypothetical protein H6500_06870 [Candidatus Woesearchaeota archaeon]
MKFEIGLYDHDGVIANSLKHAWETEKEQFKKIGAKKPTLKTFRKSHDSDYDSHYLKTIKLSQSQYQKFNATYRKTEGKIKAKLPEIQMLPGAKNTLLKSSQELGKENIHIISGSQKKELEDFYKKNKLPYGQIHSIWDSKAEIISLLSKKKKTFFLTDSGKDILSAKKAKEKGANSLIVIVLATKYSFSNKKILEKLAKENSDYVFLARNFKEVNKILFTKKL